MRSGRLALLALLAVGCSPGLFTRQISGTVVDAGTGAPVPEAFVVVHVMSHSLLHPEVFRSRDVMWTRTSSNGTFVFHDVVDRLFPFNIGWQTQLRVIAPGYEAALEDVRGPGDLGWPSRVTMVKRPGPLACDLLWPSYEARGVCQRLVARTT